MSMAMHPRDLKSFLEAQNRERTPEEQEHDRRLEHRVDEYRVHFTGGPMGHPIDETVDKEGYVLVVTERPGDLALLRQGEWGMGVSHYGGRTKDNMSEHDWEEQGHVTTYPWNRIAFVEHRWWIDEDAFNKAEEGRSAANPRPGQYL